MGKRLQKPLYGLILLLLLSTACIGQDPCENVRCTTVCRGEELWEQKCVGGECVDYRILEKKSEECGYYDLCKHVECENECYGSDLYKMKCSEGECVPDYVIEKNSEQCVSPSTEGIIPKKYFGIGRVVDTGYAYMEGLDPSDYNPDSPIGDRTGQWIDVEILEGRMCLNEWYSAGEIIRGIWSYGGDVMIVGKPQIGDLVGYYEDYYYQIWEKVEYEEYQSGAIEITDNIDADKDGIYDRFDMCFNPGCIIVNLQNGCPLDSDNDGLENCYDECPYEAGEKANKGCPQETPGIIDWEGDIPVIDWRYADQFYGEYVIVEGTIVDTYNSGKACFLNFHTDWSRYFSAVIFASDFYKFSKDPEVYYLGKKVRIRGVVQEYEGKPEIIVENPSQIEIIG